MSSTGTSASKKRAQYTIRACNGCRRRRCKCDGVQPTCGTCAFYGHECSWSADSDGNRPATKQLIESLRVKIQVLEAEIRELQMKDGESAEDLTNQDHSGFLRVSRDDSSVGGAPVPISFRTTTPRASQYHTAHERSEHHAIIGATSSLRTISSHDPAYQFIFNINASIPPSEQSENIQQSLSCEWNRYLPLLDGVRFSRLEHDTLLDRCFKYSTCWLLGLVPQLFLKDMLRSLAYNRAKSPPSTITHYSALLHCSLLALATAFSDDPFIKWRSTREKFAQHAKQLLEAELHTPSPTLAQSLAMLSEYHCGVGENERGYMYMGMSIRTVCALGLSEVRIRQADRSSPLDQASSIVRDWNFWSIFSQDKLMSLEYNRDFDLEPTRTDAQPPYIDIHIDRSMLFNARYSSSTSETSQSSRLTQVFEQSCRLMQVAVDIISVVHFRMRNGLAPQREESMVIRRKLDVWLNNLPAELLLSDDPPTTPLPHVIVLNMCFWWFLLLVHRPFYGLSGDEFQSFEALSTEQCDHAARRIVQLANLYNYWHGLRFFPRNMIQVILAAGSMFLQQYALLPANANGARASAQMGARECIDALRVISETWECAESPAAQLEARLQSQKGFS